MTMENDHKHCRMCHKAIPTTARPRYCSSQCEDIGTVFLIALIGVFFGVAAYVCVFILGASGG